MRRLLLGLFVFAACLPVAVWADDAQEEAIQQDRQRIEGRWQITSLTVNGNQVAQDDIKQILVINGSDGTWELRADGEVVSRGTSTFDPTQSPKTMDFVPSEGDGSGEEYLAIYELGDNERRMCFAPAGSARPTEFASPPGSEDTLVVFQRVAPTPSQQQRAEFSRLRELANPGDEHALLIKLTGTWNVAMKAGENDFGFDGQATASMILGGRFLVVDGHGQPGGRHAAFRYTIGFDRRHDEYVIILMDTTGTYHVSARGKPSNDQIRMFGTDDDPRMKKMGLEKKFAFDLDIASDDQFSITTIYVDTRTKAETLRPAFTHVFTRANAAP